MDRQKFYAALRARDSGVFGTSLSQKQVSGCELLLDTAERRRTPLRHLAYILATTYHETAHTMQPIAEIGKGKGREYGKPAGPFGQVYYGRGYVQLTWLANYRKAGDLLGYDLVRFPDKAMDPKIAADILFAGMQEGWFTGKKLTDYIADGRADYHNARRIVNGLDRAALIAGYAKAFESALRAGAYTNLPTHPDIPPSAPAAPEKPAGGILSIIISILARLFGRTP